jgi:hypothetical protein
MNECEYLASRHETAERVAELRAIGHDAEADELAAFSEAVDRWVAESGD